MHFFFTRVRLLLYEPANYPYVPENHLGIKQRVCVLCVLWQLHTSCLFLWFNPLLLSSDHTPNTWNQQWSLSHSPFSLVLCVVFGVVVCLKRGVLVVMACWVKQEAQSWWSSRQPAASTTQNYPSQNRLELSFIKIHTFIMPSFLEPGRHNHCLLGVMCV